MVDREKQQLARAKSCILSWFDKQKPNVHDRSQLSRDIDLFFSALKVREQWSECKTDLLNNVTAVPVNISCETWRAMPCDGGLAVSSVMPGWGFGWRSVLPNETSYEILSWLGHYARQYVHRSRIAAALMVVWEQESVVLDPFGSGGFNVRYGPTFAPITVKVALDDAVKEVKASWCEREYWTKNNRSKWRLRNTLDPAIHQAIFHFLRGQSLRLADFDLEALVAFDSCIQSLQKLNWPKTSGDVRNSRSDFCAALGFKGPTVAHGEQIYFLRNNFAVHAGGWRWWDWYEYVDEDFMEQSSRFALRALRRAADLEPDMRRIDPIPTNWFNWLLQGFPVIWDAVWFRDKV